MEKVKLIYQGRRLNNKDQVRYSYKNTTTKKNEWYSKKLINCSVGGIVEAVRTDTGVKQPYEFIGRHSDDKEISEWSAKDWAVSKQIQVNREMKKVPKTEYDDLVGRFNDLIFYLSPVQKKLFTYRLLNDIKI